MTVEDLRKHVTDDAFELMTTVCLVDPLATAAALSGDVKLLLRRVLSRQVVLVLTRLHANPGTGRAGVTASIAGVLQACHAEHRLASAEINEFSRRRRRLVQDMEAQGVKLKDITLFRNAELAHSLHPHGSGGVGNIDWPTISAFAHGTNELVGVIEGAIVASGGRAFPLFGPREQAAWLGHARSFWK